MEIEKCTTLDNRKIIVLKEKKSQLRLLNNAQKELISIQVDGCLIDETEEKCDWLVLCNISRRALFIELKGCDVDKAISQLENTLRLTRDIVRDNKKECYIVCTRYPKASTSVLQRQIKFFRANSATLSIQRICSEVNI